MAIEQLLIAGVGLGLNLFGQGQQEENADKIIQAQYEQARRQWKFQTNDRNDLYEYEKSATEAARANNRNEIAYREALDLQNWNNQVQLNTDDFKAKQKAYETSVEDYETQLGINEQTEELALAQTKQKFFDQKTALGFQKREQISKQVGQYNQLITQLGGAQNALSDALMQETLQETAALRDRNQSLDRLNLQADRLAEQSGEARTTAELNNKALQAQIDTRRTGRDEELMRLQQQQDTDTLNTDNSIARTQLETLQNTAKQQLGLAQTTDSANLDSDIARDQASMQISNAQDAFGDATLSRDQQIAELDDRLKYNIFNRDAELGDLDFEQSSAKLQYEQQRAAKAFQQQSNHIEKLVQEGNVGAAGRQGLSAARSINNVLAAAGRQSAQLTDSIMRDAESYANITSNIDRKKGVTTGRAELTRKTLERNKTEADAILDRAELDQNRTISQAETNRDNKIDSNNLRISQATESSSLNIKQTQDTAEQKIGDLQEGRALRNDQSVKQAAYVNKKFSDAFNSLSVEQELLADNLNKQLASYGFEVGSLNQQKEFARQNYNVAVQAAQEVHDSALRRYQTSAEAVTMERDRLEKQNTLIEDQYAASIASAEQAKLASEAGIALDRYSADVTADKAVMPEPIQAPNPPAPIKYPETVYMDPRKPLGLPKPKKGPGAQANYMGAVGSFVTNIAGIDWD